MKEYGHFCKNGFKIKDRNTPNHWYNYLFNDEYISSISQVGYGQSFAKRFKRNIAKDRAIYISDGERIWQANALPVQKALQHYHCFHGIGYTDIIVSNRAVRSECRFFVPTHGKREFLRIIIKNESRQTKTLKVIPYYALEENEQSPLSQWGKFMEDQNCVVSAVNEKSATHYTYLLASDTVTGFDACKNSFIGPYGNKLQPLSIIENLGCSNSECIGESTCLALENTITLAPGENKVFYYTFGIEESLECIPQTLPAEIEEQFIEVTGNLKEIYDHVRIHTPWDDLDELCNDWLKHQTNLGAHWARINTKQFRDLAADTECLSCLDAKLAAQKLCDVLAFQNEAGDVPFDCLSGKPSTDSAVWAVFATYAIVKELGNIDFLLRKVPFNNGETATVYEHIKRAVTLLWKFTGHFGLIKIGNGDWTESIDGAGNDGKGVSVWLSIAFVRAAKMLSQMANWIGSEADSKTATYYAQEMEKRVNQYGWDSDRYLYAISDGKKTIGSIDNREGALFALPQIWCILSEFDGERSQIAMTTLEKELNTDVGLLICHPPFTAPHSHVGSLSQQPAGFGKNGSIHLHVSAWKLIADTILKNNDAIEEGLRKILPTHYEYFKTSGAPYALAEIYLGLEAGNLSGSARNNWYTGQWLLYALTRYVYGLQPEFGGMLIRPCLPTGWKDCSITKDFRECRYNVHYVQKDKGPCNTIDAIYVNGTQVNVNLPIRPQAGKTLNIEIILRA